MQWIAGAFIALLALCRIETAQADAPASRNPEVLAGFGIWVFFE